MIHFSVHSDVRHSEQLLLVDIIACKDYVAAHFVAVMMQCSHLMLD